MLKEPRQNTAAFAHKESMGKKKREHVLFDRMLKSKPSLNFAVRNKQLPKPQPRMGGSKGGKPDAE